MRILLIFIFTGIFCLTNSCTKEKSDLDISIHDISRSKESDLQQLVEMRLSLAKVVSIAFDNDEFRNYFKATFGRKSDRGNFFEECLIIRHLNDAVLSDGTTFQQFLNGIHDSEVHQIFGDDFLDFIIQNDNRVTLKLPDMFLEYEWDTDKTIPVVFATYPARTFEDNLVGYHLGKHREENYAIVMPSVFHVNIKASEDYVILNTTTLRDEFSNAITEFLPQMVDCTESIEMTLEGSELYENNYIVDLRNAFITWQELCGFKGSYIDTGNCEQICQRNCTKPMTSHYVLDHFSMIDFNSFQALREVYFREAFCFNAQFYDIDTKVHYTSVNVPVVRISELGMMFKITGKPHTRNSIPHVDISHIAVPDEINPIDIKYHIVDGTDLNLQHVTSYLNYGDKYYLTRDLNGLFPNEFNPTRVIMLGVNIYESCDLAITSITGSGLSWVFRY